MAAINAVDTVGTPASPNIDAVEKFMDWIKTEGPQWLATNGVAIVITLVIAVVALRLAKTIANRFSILLQRGKADAESAKRAQTLSGVIRWVLRMTIIVVAGLMILDKLGVQIGPIIAAAGIVGLAVGFGAQNLVQDIISGFFILLEDQVRVGDVVSLNDKAGLVERITLRMIVRCVNNSRLMHRDSRHVRCWKNSPPCR